jgi:hypothetical protein
MRVENFTCAHCCESGSGSLFHFDEDPIYFDPTFHIDAHSYPVSHQSDATLRPLVTKLSKGRTRPPGYIDRRNSFLGIDSGAPYTFENISSAFDIYTDPELEFLKSLWGLGTE